MIGDKPLCGNICLECNVFQNLPVSLYGILLLARAPLRNPKVSKNIRISDFSAIPGSMSPLALRQNYCKYRSLK